MQSPHKHLWQLDPSITFLNHGSFGACPIEILAKQTELRAQLESEPVHFMVQKLPDLWNPALEALASFIDGDVEGLAFVTNATTGVNAVLRSLEFEPGDELLCTNHEYNACRNILNYVAERSGAIVRVAQVPFPLNDPKEVVDAVMKEVGPKTKLTLLDHVTSATALVLPIEELVSRLKKAGSMVLVDGAHALGMLDISMGRIGADFYTSNAHKWLCTPKGAAFLWVAAEYREVIRPAVISHGANAPTAHRSRFRWEFDWQGTCDPTPWLCIPEALGFMARLFPGGWDELRTHNRNLVLAGREIILDAIQRKAPCPDSMIGSIATIPLGSGPSDLMEDHFATLPLQETLFAKYGIQVPLHHFPQAPNVCLRISAQAHNCLDDYKKLASALVAEIKE